MGGNDRPRDFQRPVGARLADLRSRRDAQRASTGRADPQRPVGHAQRSGFELTAFVGGRRCESPAAEQDRVRLLAGPAALALNADHRRLAQPPVEKHGRPHGLVEGAARREGPAFRRAHAHAARSSP